ncbi:hypothetical protein KAX75_03960, partial [candidate division WOR-3 bacterium]|nr:hypothetical protein [candidate division WOR-3 bacterium]
ESILGNTFEVTEGGGKTMFNKFLNLNNLCVLCGEVFSSTFLFLWRDYEKNQDINGKSRSRWS